MKRTADEIAADPRAALVAQMMAGNDGTAWMHEPFNLYVLDHQADTYLDLMDYGPYGGGFHRTIRHLFRKNAGEIAGLPAADLEVYDLGPGYPDKTFSLLRAMQQANIAGAYIPVDISRRFLRLATAACSPFGFPVRPMNCLFEDLPRLLSGSETPRLFIMGVTFMNYRPEIAISLLREVMGSDRDAAVIAVEFADPYAMEGILAPYRSDKARIFNQLPLEIAGVRPELLRYSVRYENSRVEMGFTISETCAVPGGVVLRQDSRLVTSISYRHTFSDLEPLLRASFDGVRWFHDPGRRCAVIRLSKKISGGCTSLKTNSHCSL